MSRELERLLSSQEPSVETLKRKRVNSDFQSSKRAETIANYQNQNGTLWLENTNDIQAMNISQKPKSPQLSAIDVSTFSYSEFANLCKYAVLQMLTMISRKFWEGNTSLSSVLQTLMPLYQAVPRPQT
jgi:hypothetical protein